MKLILNALNLAAYVRLVRVGKPRSTWMVFQREVPHVIDTHNTKRVAFS